MISPTLGEQLGMGGPAEHERIVHDLDVIRRHGLHVLRDGLDGHPVPPDLYLAVLARLAHRSEGRVGARRAWEDFNNAEERAERTQDRSWAW